MTPTHPETPGRRMARLDGNAAGGPLSEIFGVDLTDAIMECRHCRHRVMARSWWSSTATDS